MKIQYKEVFATFPLMDPYRLHKRIWQWFPNPNGGRPFLYRFDRVGDKLIVCLRVDAAWPLSAQPATAAQLREVDGQPGAEHAFTIRVVPEIRVGSRVVALPMNEDAARWFASKAPDNGFEVDRIEASSRPLVFRGKRNRKITLNDTVIHGRLSVTGSSQFATTLLRGIGRHKGFGFGMLQIKH